MSIPWRDQWVTLYFAGHGTRPVTRELLIEWFRTALTPYVLAAEPAIDVQRITVREQRSETSSEETEGGVHSTFGTTVSAWVVAGGPYNDVTVAESSAYFSGVKWNLQLKDPAAGTAPVMEAVRSILREHRAQVQPVFGPKISLYGRPMNPNDGNYPQLPATPGIPGEPGGVPWGWVAGGIAAVVLLGALSKR